MNDELPEGWVTTTLGDICSKPQYGWTSRAAKTGRIRYVRTTDISNGSIEWAKVPYCEDIPDDIEKYGIKSDDISVSRTGSVGVSLRVTDVPCDAVFASYLIRFKLAKAFRGELVPTEAELARREGRKYEPASVLLERIRRTQSNRSERRRRSSRVKGPWLRLRARGDRWPADGR